MTDDLVTTYAGDLIGDLPADAWFGLYLARSVKHPHLCRVGAAGFRNGIAARLRTHRGSAPVERKNPPNWTELHRPFRPFWVAHLQKANAVATRCCERELQAQLAKIVRYVDESGFDAGECTDDVLIDVAERCAPAFRDLLAFQTGPFFEKPRRSGDRWYASSPG